MKFFPRTCLALSFCVGVAAAQPAPAPLTFEVASVKPAPPLDPQKMMSGQMRIGKKVDKARVTYSSLSLDALLIEAYKVKSYQLQGPDWISGMSAPRFDIEAKLPEGATEDQVPEMLQALLAERFGLKIHKDTKEKNVYSLVVAPGGLKMKPYEPPKEAAPEDPAQGIKITGSPQDPKGFTVKGGPDGGSAHITMSPDMKSMRMEMDKMPMNALVEMLTRMVDRPVVDQTGLKGDYKVALNLSLSAVMAMSGMAGGMPGGGGGDANKVPEAADPGTSVFESVQQLGLKLESKKAPVVIIVVDHLEKAPTEN